MLLFTAHGVSLFYTIRGITTDVLYVDEAAFVPKALYDTLVFPLFGNSETTVIMTSSPVSRERNKRLHVSHIS